MTGKRLRLTNFIIDTCIYLILMILFIWIFKNTFGKEDVKWISILCYFLYYFIFEYFLGQTIGKIFTKSKVESKTGNKSYFFLQIFGRTIMRFIPIDIISYLFSSNGLHDRISKTAIIKNSNT